MDFGVIETCQKCNKKVLILIAGQTMAEIPTGGTSTVAWQCPECGFRNEMPVVKASSTTNN